ncbi:MAG: hypothetical protein ACOX8H_13650 [Ruminococcus sp.]
MRKKPKTDSWKEKNVRLWKKMADAYCKVKVSPSVKRVLRFAGLILRIVLSVMIRKIFLFFFPDD